MKKLILPLLILTFILVGSMGFAQTTTKKPVKQVPDNQIDTRIDNMGYWMEKAEEGIVPFNPRIPILPAIYKSDRISVKGVKTTTSTDIPVTNLTNATESENSVFVDPNNADYLLNSNNSTSWSGGSVGTLYGANYFQSSNAGLTWGGTVNGAGGANSGDPTTAIGLNGRQYINFISSTDGQAIAYSDDGSTWLNSTIAPSPGDLADKNHMWIDNSPTSPYEGNLYTAWTDFGGTDDTQIKISHSTNDGVTWSTPINISSAILAGSHNQGVNVQTGPNGEVYVVWAVYDSWPSDETAIGFAKSTDGGVTFQPAVRVISNIKGIRNTAVSKSQRVNSFPVMAVDISGGGNNGNLYIVWTNVGVPGTNTGTNKSVYLIRSTNGGTTWSTPIRVNQGANVAGKEAYFPWISCDPETGVLSAVFYDDRNTTSAQCETFAGYSLDAGNTWTDFAVSDVAFTPTPITGLASSYMGDYLGITSKGGKVYPCWTDTRGGLFMTYVSPFELGLNAAFSTPNTTICTGTSINFTQSSTGSPVSWDWSFPGGTPSSYSGANPPAITYSSAGTYDVTLIVSDGTASDTTLKPGYISVKNVIAEFSGSPTTVVVGNTVTFTDNSSCSPSSWTWSFPGGTPSTFSGLIPPAITYNTLGTYNVALSVSNAIGSDTKTKTGYITVAPPIFNMTNGSVTTCSGNFYDSGSSSGSYQNNENFTETFYPSTPGSMIRFTFTSFSTESGYDFLRIYNGTSTSATLIGTYQGTTGPTTVTASNTSGALTFNFTSDGSVISTGWSADVSCYSTTVPPVADFSASSTSPVINTNVTFTDLSTNIPTSWSWSFSPNTVSYVSGTNSTSQNPIVQFTAAGSYQVSLTATNAYGSDTETKTGYINAANCIPCTSASNYASDEWISNVTFNTINNTSAGSVGYQNFTSISTNVDLGGIYNLSVTCTQTDSWTEHCFAFFDWNHDCDFADSGESVDLGQVSTSASMNLNITIPTDALPGATRMRVSLKYNSNPTSCEAFSYGQVEDYTVNVQSPTRNLHLTLFLEGLFNGSTMNKARNATGDQFTGLIADQITVELHNSTEPFMLAGGPYLVDISTSGIADISIPVALSSTYYVVVKHRNSIETWSASPLLFSSSDIYYNFSTSSTQAYGNNLKLKSGKYVIYGYDVNQDGIIDASDLILSDNASANYTSGYLATDANGDGVVNKADVNIIFSNSYYFIKKIVP